NLTGYPTGHGPNYTNSIVMGWSVDYVPSAPSTILGLFNWYGRDVSAKSVDGGKTWAQFASYPPISSKGHIGGHIAASSATNWVWFPCNEGNPYFTSDGGRSWKQILIEGIPTDHVESGWCHAYYFNRHIIDSDKTNGDLYVYNNGSASN